MDNGNTCYGEGKRLFLAGELQAALPLLAEALKEQETCERWNDWATASFLAGRPVEAERGYRCALDLDPCDAQAAANLGVVLTGQKRLAEATPYLENSLQRLDEPQRTVVDQLLLQCRSSRETPNQNTDRESAPEATPLYFFHIPKTSGVSFHHFLAKTFGEGAVSPPMIWDAWPADLSTARNWKVWVGHFGGLLPFVLKSWPRMVTILRDPVDRTISHINHIRRAPDHPLHTLAEGLSFLEYCHHTRLRRTVDNFQARYLASLSFAQSILKTARHPVRATSALAFEDALFSLDSQFDLLESALHAMSEMEMVGIAEKHVQTLKLFSQKFNGPSVSAAHRENAAGDGQARRADLSNEELECIQKLTRIDQLVYDCASERFERECRQANIGNDVE